MPWLRTCGKSACRAGSTSSLLRRNRIDPAFPYAPTGPTTFCATSPDPNCLRDNYSLFLLQNAFFVNALTKPDQLRQRVAFALSQILVTSGVEVNFVYGMAHYEQILLDNAFGNYQDLLTEVTLSPVMGDFLNMVNNNKADGTVSPNENYAREVMQLFSIGVWELNPDGTQLLDAQGEPIPTYTQPTVGAICHAVHRLDLSAAGRNGSGQPQPEELPERHGRGARRARL